MKKLEVRRQLVHLSLGLVLVILLYSGFLKYIGHFFPIYFLKSEARPIFLIFIFGFLLSILSRRFALPIIKWFLAKFERKNEEPGRGALYGALGSFLVINFFSNQIALASIIILAIGDSLSHLIGKNYGKISNPLKPDKKIEGSFIGFLGGFLGAIFFVSTIEAFIASFTAMSLESFDLIIDDNLSIPIIAALAIQIIHYL
ncbi:MAG: Dolichol kinase Sec59 [Candidatus Methanohalarchaeum thermophilum]|uniref:Dolichol kinase Sec59 n=1 Tax=Methanohalarchaeum thermophilum TaxID=1903181 RepID=A0A1Q6DU31_METT1|nr:MAG: Dolichol kinase Sec59 [Candidatus Methanohalarchaeum thermophilum]